MREDARPCAAAPIPIVLTGTIVPNIVGTCDADWRVRRGRYLEAIAFYKEFSKVYFLENSSYDLTTDDAFVSDGRCHILKFPLSESPDRGKGYQEFQMLDRFVTDNLREDRFVKVTGRFVCANFAPLFSFLLEKGQEYDVVIDRLAERRVALTSLFYAEKRSYLRHFQDAYLEMNDESRIWAEHVVYARLACVDAVTFFPAMPVQRSARRSSVSDLLKLKAKNWQRRALSTLRMRELWC